MATKSGQQEPEKGEVIEELLDALDTTLDRVKVLYEQYFLGIQKQPPTYLHTDIERKTRDLSQLQIRNTAHRYRFTTLQQKFGAYNSYWRRTLRQIENGTYIRNLSKISRQAARSGADVPEEILAAMPKRMREQVRRDREAALARAKRHEAAAPADDDLLTLAEDDVDVDLDDLDAAALVEETAEASTEESTNVRRNKANGAHRIDEDDEFDIDAYFASVTSEPAAASDAGRPTTGQPKQPKPPVGPVAAPSKQPTVATQALPRPTSIRPSTAISPLAAAAMASDATAAPTPTSAMPPVAVPPIPAKLPTVAAPAIPRPTTSIAAQLAASATPTSAQPSMAPSQATRPLPIAAGAAAAQTPAAVETMAGPFPRLPNLPPLPSTPIPAIPRPAAEAELAPASAIEAAGKRAQLITPDGMPPQGLEMRMRTPPSPPPGSAAAGANKGHRPAMERTFMAPIERTRPPAGLADPAIPERVAPERTPLPVRVPVRAATEPPKDPPSDFPDERTERASVARPLPPPPPRAGVSRVERLPTEYLRDLDDLPGGANRSSADRPLPPPPPRAPRTPPLGRPVTARPPSELPDDFTEPNPIEPPQPPMRSGPPRTPPFGRPATEQPDELPPPPRIAAKPQRPERPPPPPGPPPGMSDADVNALYTKYIQAKKTLGEDAGPNAYGKLLQTINAQAPKIMQQYKSKGVDFSVVVKDNQVIIRAKPKP